MDSGLSQRTPSPSPPPPKISLSGIRAPLTIDSDVEFEQSSSGKDYYFYSDSEGFLSGEDEFERDSEGPGVNYGDGVEGFQESSDSGTFRPLATIVNDNFEESKNLDDYMVSNPYSSDQLDQSVEDDARIDENGNAKVKYSDMGSEYASDDNVDDQVLFWPRASIPIAQVSGDGDSDYDSSVHSEALDDANFFSPVRIPAGVSERFNSIAKVRMLEDVEEGYTPMKSELFSKLNSVKDSVGAEFVSEQSSTSDVKERSVPLGGIESDEAVQDSVHDVSDCVGQDCSQPSEQGKESEHSAAKSNVQDDDVHKQSLDTENHIDDIHGFESTKVVQDDVHSQSSEPGQECDHSTVDTKVQHADHIYEKQGEDLHKEAEQIDLDNETVDESHNEQTDWMIESHDNLTVSGSHSPEGSIQVDGVPNTGQANSPDKVAHHGSMHAADAHHLQSHVVEDEIDLNPTDGLVEDVDLFPKNDANSLILGPDITEEEMEQLSQSLIPDTTPVDEISEDYVGVDGEEVTTDSDEEFEGQSDQGEEMFDTASFDALLKAAINVGIGDNSTSVISSEGTTVYPLERSGGLRSLFHPLEPSTTGALSKPAKKQLENLQQIRVKYLRLLQRLDRSEEDLIAGQTLYKLVLAAGKNSIQEFGFESAKRAAMELEADGKNDLNLSINILVIGKTGVGKSATINSIFAEKKAMVDAFEPTTAHVKEITGIVNGVNIRVLDTPGLRSSLAEQPRNRKILCLIKKFISKYPPDVVLYVDRLDSQARDLNDLPLLKSITKYLGSAMWRNVIVTLTHGASPPPDGPYGSPISYKTFITKRARLVQQLINYSLSDASLLAPGFMCPVSLVENNLFQADGNGETLLPNGENWRSQLLLLCCSTKVLSEAASVLNTGSAIEHKRSFGNWKRPPPLLYFLSSLLQTTTHPKMSIDGGVENGDFVAELSYSSESDHDDEYDQLPPFKTLRKSEIEKLSKDHRKAYHDEYDYRVKLLQRKQLREEVKRIREMKKGKSRAGNYDHIEGENDQESGNSISVPLPDMELPPSFDGNNPAYRYRFLEPSSQLRTRPLVDSRGWDHDFGYDGVSFEDSQVIAGQLPAVLSVQLTKDKRKFNILLNSSVAAQHGDKGSTMAGLGIHTLGKQLAYIMKSEYKLRNYKINETAATLAVTFVGENIATGLKMADEIALGKLLTLAASTGATHCQGDAAYGTNVEVRLREKDYPVGQDQSTFGLSLMKWRGELIWGCNLLSEFSVGKNYKIGIKCGLNNKMNGQISVRTISSDQLQIVMLALVPIAETVFRNIFWQSTGMQ